MALDIRNSRGFSTCILDGVPLQEWCTVWNLKFWLEDQVAAVANRALCTALVYQLFLSLDEMVLQTIIRTLVTLRLGYCNVFYMRLSLKTSVPI